MVIRLQQMLSVGGARSILRWPALMLDPDPWIQGLGVFDMAYMTDMALKSQ